MKKSKQSSLDDNKALRDKSGKIETYADGSPILYKHFTNDLSDEHFERENNQSEQEFLEEILDLDLELSDEQMSRMGFVKNKEGDWSCKEKGKQK